MSKPVATAADVQTTAGTTPYTGAASGTWTPPVTITTVGYSKVKVGGQKVIYEADGTFTFAGLTGGGAPISGTDDVSLKATDLGSTKLQKGENSVLRDGDTTDGGSYGNKIYISSTRKLKSA
jgi:hypothetical protein